MSKKLTARICCLVPSLVIRLPSLIKLVSFLSNKSWFVRSKPRSRLQGREEISGLHRSASRKKDTLAKLPCCTLSGTFDTLASYMNYTFVLYIFVTSICYLRIRPHLPKGRLPVRDFFLTINAAISPPVDFLRKNLALSRRDTA